MLEVHRGSTASYGPVRALRGVSFDVPAASITAVLGANGAGKTTLLRTLSGLVTTAGGRVVLDGKDLRRVPVEQLVRRGMAHVPEGRGVIAELTVEENLRLGGLSAGAAGARASTRSTTCSRGYASAASRPRTRSRAASARCSPSAAR